MFYLSTNSKYHKRDLSHSQSLAFSSRPPPSFRERLRSVDVFFFSFRTCINFLLLYRVEINILFDWQSPDLNIWFTSRPIKSLHDNDVLTAGLLLLFSHLTDGRLLVRRMARAGETELRFKASTLRACDKFFSLTAILSWRFVKRKENDMRIEKALIFDHLLSPQAVARFHVCLHSAIEATLRHLLIISEITCGLIQLTKILL